MPRRPNLEMEFIRGFAAALGTLSRGFGSPNTARMIMEENNYTLADFEAADCEEYDIELIRKDLMPDGQDSEVTNGG